jgi:hypothetical protein
MIMGKINKRLLPNRYLIWAFATVFFSAIILLGYIKQVGIEIERQAMEDTVFDLSLRKSSKLGVSPFGWRVYRNEEFGFELILTGAWRGHEVEVRFDKYIPEIKYINFRVPTKSKTYGDGSGFATPFTVGVYPVGEWEKLNTESEEHGRSLLMIAQNDEYAFSYLTWQDPPFDLVNKDFDIEKIISTFQFIELEE